MAYRAEPFTVFLFGMRLNSVRGLPRFLWGLRMHIQQPDKVAEAILGY